MEYRKKETVRQSGFISYIIQYKRLMFWINYQSFTNRQSRDIYFNKLQNESN